VASNPEFLREGTAVTDFFGPDRIVIGADSPRAREVLDRLYRPLSEAGHDVIHMDVASAELTKYAANAMLATRISFMNQIAELCQATGADVELVRAGVGSDDRIGPRFLRAGVGYGGSCFPKDVRALVRTATEHGVDLPLLRAVHDVNERQKHVATRRLEAVMGLRGAHVAVWGATFKPDTDDLREAPALTIVADLVAAGATVAVFDPVVSEQLRVLVDPAVRVATDPIDAAMGADALIHVTEWKEFLDTDPCSVADVMRGTTVLDGRNLLDAQRWAGAGFEVLAIGRATIGPVADGPGAGAADRVGERY
jgi:UDPglucose 6-dehydrogenase